MFDELKPGNMVNENQGQFSLGECIDTLPHPQLFIKHTKFAAHKTRM